MTNYSSNVSDSGWQIISKYLNTARCRKYDLREVWNALMYVVKTGCQWRMLPHDFPRWEIVYYYYRKWINEELNDLILEKLRSIIRVRKGQKARATLAIMDSQSVRWGNNRSFKSYDGNKKVKGIKRHVVVDKNGFLLAVMVTVAHIHDSKAVIWLMRVLKEYFHGIKVILADGGYRGDIVDDVKNKFGYLLKIVMGKQPPDKSFKPVLKDGL
ncbi:IS5 family transposase [Arachidicoccus ginsenosidimutans]|uniref:IS5 family transposase n=1 Tax=Arachidicoccus sp. BS20 TaxID=1850526 RepID=UPI000A89550B|nr:IS5 family transposase [Arachidicoccus sp. BS20]